VNNLKKIAFAFVLGGILGLAVGGFLGYEIGSSDPRINTAPGAKVVEVKEVTRPPKTAPDAATPANAAVTETAAETAPTTSQSGTEEYVISPNDESELMWVGYKTVLGQKMSMEGGFANFNGSLSVVNNNPDESFVDFTVDINSIFSVNNILTGVLKGDQFFDVAKFPEAKFESTKIEATADGYTVTGNFTLHGVTQGVQFPAKIERRGENVYVEAEFKINRKQWNVGYDSFEDALILEEVVISFKVLAEPADPTKAAPEKTAPREVTPVAPAAAVAPATPAASAVAEAPAAPAEAPPAQEQSLDEWVETGTKTMSQQPVI